MSTTSTADDTTGPIKMLTLKDLATILGVNTQTARGLVLAGEIHGFQVGARGLWRVEPVELQAYVAREKTRSSKRPRSVQETADADHDCHPPRGYPSGG